MLIERILKRKNTTVSEKSLENPSLRKINFPFKFILWFKIFNARNATFENVVDKEISMRILNETKEKIFYVLHYAFEFRKCKDIKQLCSQK